MNKIHCLAALVTAYACSSVSVSAHPGHSFGEADVAHILTSPFHLIVLALIGIAFVGVAVLVKHKVPRRALQVTGIAALVTAMILGSLPA